MILDRKTFKNLLLQFLTGRPVFGDKMSGLERLQRDIMTTTKRSRVNEQKIAGPHITFFFLHFFAVPAQLRRETPKFDFLHRGSAQTKTNFPFPL